ncbi:MAG: type Z 30S ribosomal protein S14 [Planctomycetaceae bacterium]
MASKAKIEKANRTPKYSSRQERRCALCGRPRAVYRKFKLCRICFRNMCLEGVIPGVKKSSW